MLRTAGTGSVPTAGTGAQVPFCRTLHSGHPPRPPMTTSVQPRRFAPWVAGTVLLIAFAVLYAYASRVPLGSSADRPLDPARAIAAGEELARRQLADPESARFRGAFVDTRWLIPVTCGEINFRNATGGYAGFRRFVSSGPVSLREDQMSEEQFRNLWSTLCGPFE